MACTGDWHLTDDLLQLLAFTHPHVAAGTYGLRVRYAVIVVFQLSGGMVRHQRTTFAAAELARLSAAAGIGQPQRVVRSGMPLRQKPSLRARFIFFCVFSAFAALFTVLDSVSLWEQLHASETTAQVTAINEPRGRYTITFTTSDGTVCADSVVAPVTELRGVSVGDTIQVRYTPNRVPCSNVYATSDQGWWGFSLIAPILLVAGVVAAAITWRRRDW